MTQAGRQKISDELKRDFAMALINTIALQTEREFSFEERHLLIPFIKSLSNGQTKALFDSVATEMPSLERSEIAKLYHSSIYPFLARPWTPIRIARIKTCCDEQAMLAVIDSFEENQLDRELLFSATFKQVYSLMAIDSQCDEQQLNQKEIRDIVSDYLRKALAIELGRSRQDNFRFSLDLPPKTLEFKPMIDLLVEKEE